MNDFHDHQLNRDASHLVSGPIIFRVRDEGGVDVRGVSPLEIWRKCRAVAKSLPTRVWSAPASGIGSGVLQLNNWEGRARITLVDYSA